MNLLNPFLSKKVFSTTLLASFAVGLFFLLSVYLLATAKPPTSFIDSSTLASADGLSKQMRQKIRKEFWVVKDKERLHTILTAQSSELILQKKQRKFSFQEDLKNYKCWMQDKIETSPLGYTQQIRFLEGVDGLFFYNEQTFSSEDVSLRLYQTLGKELLLTAPATQVLFEGQAKQITLRMHPDKRQFLAKKFIGNIKDF